jgi:mannosyl-oligosaccharide alpha-1,2-mannosidase
MALRYRLRYGVSLTITLITLYLLLHTSHPPRRIDSTINSSHDHLYSTRPPKIQHVFPPGRVGADIERLHAVKHEFVHAYHGYRAHAWMRDGLKPLSGGSYTQYCGWAATLIDALDTLYIMGMWEEFDEAVEAVLGMSLRWAPSLACSVNPFEMTIRHLGGLLAAYDISGGIDERLKMKALQMGEMMWRAIGKNGMQCRSIIWPRLPGWSCEPNPSLSLARLGSQTVEFLRLSMVTGDEKFARQARFLASEMDRLQDSSNIPGLFPQFFDGTCEAGLCDVDRGHQTFTVGAAADSAYEYLVKGHLMNGLVDGIYLNMWERALPKIKELLLFHPQAPGGADMTFPGVVTAQGSRVNGLRGKVEHLSCFLGGLFALSARTSVKEAEDLAIADQLTEGCVWAYSVTPSGIMPDTVIISPCRGSSEECYRESKSKIGSNDDLPAGFDNIERREYILRPEAIESVFIMYRATGDQKWRDKGWDMFTAIRNATRSRYGHSAILDVMRNPGNTTQSDKMESFWLSETLKYFYLLFADPSMVSLDDWMFNTEGHTLRLEDKYRGDT